MEKFLKVSENISSASKRPIDVTSPDQFRKPKKFITNTRRVPNEKETPIRNRFDTLPVDDNESGSAPFLNATRRKTGNNTPPIVIEIKGEWTHENIKDTLNKNIKDYHMKYNGHNTVRVQCYTAQSHQKLKEGLLKDNVVFHTFTRKDEKLPKAVIKGLPKFIHASVPEELDSIGFAGATVSEIKTLRPTECPPILVQLPSGTNMSKFKQVKYLASCSITVEPYKQVKKQGGTQCYRCQGFGHASRNCNRPPRCVKCAQSHLTVECAKKDREAPATCCNCQEPHPANFSQCKERLKYIERIATRRELLRRNPSSDVGREKLTPAQSAQTWAQIAVNPRVLSEEQGVRQHRYQPRDSPVTTVPAVSTRNQPVFNRQVQPSSSAGVIAYTPPQDRETMEMLDILTTLQTIKQEFTKCKTFMEKVILVLTHLGHYV